MTTGFSRHAGSGRRHSVKLRIGVLACLILFGTAAGAWTWVFIAEIRDAPTPWWGHAVFWLLLAGIPLFAALATSRRFSATVAPGALVAGFVIASMFKDGGDVLAGDIHPAYILFVWSTIMFFAWAVGHSIIGALTAPRKTPSDY